MGSNPLPFQFRLEDFGTPIGSDHQWRFELFGDDIARPTILEFHYGK